MEETKELIFRIYTGEEGKPETIKKCSIYSDGTVEGYPEPILGIRNDHFSVVNRELGRLTDSLNELYGCDECPTKRRRDIEGGSSHGTAE